jgi:hypothetical protein
MGLPPALRIAKVLRATLQCVEESGIASPDSSELARLKQHVVRAVSELEIQKNSPVAPQSETPPETHIETPIAPEPETLPAPETEAPLVVLRMR